MPALSKSIVLISIFSLPFFSLPAPTHAKDEVRAVPELKEGMTQCDFARWLLYAIGATRSEGCGPGPETLGKVPPAHQGLGALEFASNIGMHPEGGWECEAPVTRKWLADILGYPDDLDEEFITKGRLEELMAGTDEQSFNEIIGKVKEHLGTLYDRICKTYGTFRILDSPFEQS
jgi:hypothetical protein